MKKNNKKTGLLLAAVLLFCSALPGAAFASQPVSESENGYIVKLKDSADTARLMSADTLDEISAEHRLYTAESLEQVKALGSAVEYCEPNASAHLFELPNDAYASRQWYLGSLGMESVWNRGYDGRGVRVAVVDSGVNSLHEDFEGISFDRGKNMLDGSHDVTDEMGHGTGVSGIIAAAINNGVGIAGLCDGVTIVPIKIFSSGNETAVTYIINAIYEAVDMFDCDVINLSLGTAANLKLLEEAVDYAAEHGVIIVSAVGNTGGRELNYPAAYDSAIGVGAVDKNGAVTNFSQKNASVFVTAPGSDIITPDYVGESNYSQGEGTSFAAPMVTASAVILKQFAPGADIEDFKQLLQMSVHDAGRRGYDTSYGYGILDMEDFADAMEGYGFAAVEDKYPDVLGHWAKESIEFCVQKKLFQGVTESSFAPDETMTRGMFVTVLGRMSGETINGFPVVFSDVSAADWYAQSAAWGQASGIVNGTDGSSFSPNMAVTREQMAVFLYRFAGAYNLRAKNASRASLTDYNDGAAVSDWAQTAMQWAIANGLISGRDDGSLAPKDSAKRCEVAAIAARFIRTFGMPEA